MATSKKSTGKKLKDQTSFVVATPVSLLVRLANGEEKKIRDTCGLGLEKPLANYDPITQSWKMFGDISLWGDCRLLLNLPPSGMTVSGVLYLQPAWVPITGETESLSWPTPRANTAMSATITPESAHNPKRFPNLETVVGQRMWPTPTAHPNNSNINGKYKNPTLGDAVRMWPTPIASNGMSEDISTVQARLQNGTPYKARLVEAVAQYPTPTYGKLAGGTGGFNQIEELYLSEQITLEEKKAMQAGNGGKLNPMWVEWLMGFPLGWTDLEDSETL
jgi:DNA (cytosine-5)-methyltransferase 1